jgi:hypothetical protein
VKSQSRVSGKFVVFEPAGEWPKDGFCVGDYYRVRFTQDVGDTRMDRMMRQVLAGWIRTGVTFVAGAVGLEQYANGEIGTAIVAVGVGLAMALWSALQKKEVVKA